MVTIKSQELLSTKTAGARLGVTSRRVIQLVQAGRLPAVAMTGGQRIFRVEDVEKLAQERAAAK
jgi:excisionase family DNA binding protein